MPFPVSRLSQGSRDVKRNWRRGRSVTAADRSLQQKSHWWVYSERKRQRRPPRKRRVGQRKESVAAVFVLVGLLVVVVRVAAVKEEEGGPVEWSELLPPPSMSTGRDRRCLADKSSWLTDCCCVIERDRTGEQEKV